jgi:hypothetical protein
MNYRNFEQNIKDKLYDDEADLDVNQFILDLHKKEKKSRKGLFFLLSTLGLISIGFILFSWNKYSAKNVIKSSPEEMSSSFYNGKNENLKVSQSEASSQLISISETESTPVFASQTTNNSNTSNINNTKIPTLNSTIKSLPKNTKTSQESTIQKEVLTPRVPSSIVGNYATSAVSSNENDNAANQNESEFATSTSDKIINTEVQFLSPLALVQPKALIYSNVSIIGSKNKEVVCPSFAKTNPLVFSVIPEFGYFRPLKQMTSIDNEQSVFNLRKNNEETLEGLQAALYLQVENKNYPIYIRSGLHYAQFTEKMNLSYNYTEMDTTQGIISITVSQTGDTITTIYGDIVTSKTLTGLKVAHHKFEMVDIPIAIGYEKDFGSFKIGGELGASFNVSLSSTGKLLENTVDFKTLTSTNSPYKTKLGINYFGSVFISKDILANQNIYLALRGRMIPSTFTNVGESIKENYTMVGLHLGYKVSF